MVYSILNFFASGGNGNGTWLMLVAVGVLVVVMFIFGPMMRRKKQNQYVENLQKGVQVGSTIKTLGGLIGKVVAINEVDNQQKEIVIETGAEGSKSTLTFDIMYVYTVLKHPDGSKFEMQKGVNGKDETAGLSVKVVQEGDETGVQKDEGQTKSADAEGNNIFESGAEEIVNKIKKDLQTNSVEELQASNN